MKKYFVTLILIFSTIIICFNLVNKTEESYFNLKFYQIISSSMSGDVDKFDISSLEVGDIIIVKENSGDNFYYDLCIGDVITFEYKNVTVTHRIIQIIIETNGNFIIKTKGDNSISIETLNAGEDVIYGKVIYSGKTLTFLVNLVSNNAIFIAIVILPCILIVLNEVKNICKILRGDSRKKS